MFSLPSPSSDLKVPISIDDGDGSENVTFKMNWRCFDLCRVYSNLLKMQGNFPGVDFLENRTQV